MSRWAAPKANPAVRSTAGSPLSGRSVLDTKLSVGIDSSASNAAPDGGAGNMSALDTVKTIAWSFFGVRKGHDHARSAARINPVHVVVAGFAGVLLLVVGLIVLVNVVVAK